VPLIVAAGVVLAGTAAALHYAALGLTLSHWDARAHLVVARRILDSLFPGWQQIGAVWLPLPHLLNMVPVQVDAWYRNGASAVALSVLGMGLAAWALSSLILRATGSTTAAIAAPVLMLGNPDVLYLQSTPMSEPLLFATTLLAVELTARWAADYAAVDHEAADYADYADSTSASDSASAADFADSVSAADHADPADSTFAADFADTADSSSAADHTDTTDSTFAADFADSSSAADHADTADSTFAADFADFADSSSAADHTDTADSSAAADSASAADHTDTADSTFLDQSYPRDPRDPRLSNPRDPRNPRLSNPGNPRNPRLSNPGNPRNPRLSNPGNPRNPRLTSAAGLANAAACMTRYEAWPITAALILLAGAVLVRSGVPLFKAAKACARLALYPIVAILLFLLNSRWTVGAWFISSGFFVPENTAAMGHPTVAWRQVREGVYHLSGTALVWSAYVGALLCVIAFVRSRAKSPLVLLLALPAAGVLPLYAYSHGHPFIARYGIALLVGYAAIAGAAIGLLWRPLRAVAAVTLVVAAFVQAPPLDRQAPIITEARRDLENMEGRKAVTAYLAGHYDGRVIMVSMGSLAHYVQDLSHEGFRVRDFLHEGNDGLWTYAAIRPRGYVGWILIEERAEGGDSLFHSAKRDKHFLDGFRRVAEGGGVALYRALP
jgi:hypothetical protein